MTRSKLYPLSKLMCNKEFNQNTAFVFYKIDIKNIFVCFMPVKADVMIDIYYTNNINDTMSLFSTDPFYSSSSKRTSFSLSYNVFVMDYFIGLYHDALREIDTSHLHVSLFIILFLQIWAYICCKIVAVLNGHLHKKVWRCPCICCKYCTKSLFQNII